MHCTVTVFHYTGLGLSKLLKKAESMFKSTFECSVQHSVLMHSVSLVLHVEINPCTCGEVTSHTGALPSE